MNSCKTLQKNKIHNKHLTQSKTTMHRLLVKNKSLVYGPPMTFSVEFPTA